MVALGIIVALASVLKLPLFDFLGLGNQDLIWTRDSGFSIQRSIKQDAVFKGFDCIDSDFEALSAHQVLTKCSPSAH